MPKNKSSINLLPQEEFDASIMGRLLRWAMGTFRIIVIITEMIVMAAFLSRFWLDARNSDLNDSISVKNAQIAAQSGFEKQFRNIQKKLSIFKGLAQVKKSAATLEKIAGKVPGDVTISSISLEQNKGQVKGVSGSEQGIAQLVSNLRADTFFKTATLGQINSAEDNESLTVFTVAITY